MSERTIQANGIEIWCEDFGSPRDPALLLVMGAGGQALLWPDDFCRSLAAGGRHVIRYDNRDTGQSTCVDFAAAPYTLADMAQDAVGVLDAFGIARAHVAGASMGGMIGQTLAIEHGPRLHSLTSIMSSPAGAGILRAILGGGESALPGPAPRVLEAMQATLLRPPRTPAERIEASVRMWRALAGSAEPFDEPAVRARESLMLARARNPDAAQNHQLAIGSSPDRGQLLRQVRVPTLVIHGTDDPILPLPHGRATADAIPGARWLVIEGMGHDFPASAQKEIVRAILEHTATH
ncbi:MAG TPA: alpha/beta hydrolase [Myxococcota bacterium]|nr:alpha/beta hydrolase [Myxococcota bacterium]